MPHMTNEFLIGKERRRILRRVDVESNGLDCSAIWGLIESNAMYAIRGPRAVSTILRRVPKDMWQGRLTGGARRALIFTSIWANISSSQRRCQLAHRFQPHCRDCCVVKEGRKGYKAARAMESSRDPGLSETRAWR
jgi:hypothetical protein